MFPSGVFSETDYFVQKWAKCTKVEFEYDSKVDIWTKMFASGDFSRKRMNNFIYKKYILSENMFLKTY